MATRQRTAARPARRPPPRGGWRRTHYVAGSLAMLALIAFFALLLPSITPREHESRAWIADPRWDAKGTITLAPQGEYCRRMTLDNATGEVIDLGLVRCASSPRTAAGGQEPESGSRLDAVRRSFSNRQ